LIINLSSFRTKIYLDKIKMRGRGGIGANSFAFSAPYMFPGKSFSIKVIWE
jgi:hypothetical protein